MSAPTSAPNAPPIPNWKDMSREEQIRMTELCNDFQSRRSMSTTTTNLSDAGTLNTTPNGFSQAAIDRKFQETKPEYTNWLQDQPQYQQQQSQQQQPQQQQQLPFHLPPSLSQPPQQMSTFGQPQIQTQPQQQTQNVASLMANYKPAPTPNADRSQLLAENNAMIESVSMAWKQLAHQMVDMEATFRRLVIERRDLMHKGLLAEEEEEDTALLASPTAGRGAGKKKNRTSKKDKRLASGFSRT
ncbi:hypothetical protein KHU50_006058 [Colletotrichum sp. SAR 10_65]|nr:hypothetical protein KHU50_006058 [Colletotrichum sp. SAR 10_65]